VKQRAAWRAQYPVLVGGGVLTTAGNLVFHGRSDGVLATYRASDGKQLWEFDAGTGITAPPITYLHNGIQYVSVMVGWGGPPALINDPSLGKIKPGYGRILTFTLGGTAKLNAPTFGHTEPPKPAMAMSASPQMIHEGRLLFNGQCANCHGLNAVAGALPDLRYASKAVHEQFESIVVGGARASQGMPSFEKIFRPEQVRAIQAYILSRSRESAEAALK
jgi:quinohemoprotein ethanol dehydrogenase